MHEIPTDAFFGLVFLQLIHVGLVLGQLLLELLDLLSAAAVAIARASLPALLKLTVDVALDAGNVALDDAFELRCSLFNV